MVTLTPAHSCLFWTPLTFSIPSWHSQKISNPSSIALPLWLLWSHSQLALEIISINKTQHCWKNNCVHGLTSRGTPAGSWMGQSRRCQPPGPAVSLLPPTRPLACPSSPRTCHSYPPVCISKLCIMRMWYFTEKSGVLLWRKVKQLHLLYFTAASSGNTCCRLLGKDVFKIELWPGMVKDYVEWINYWGNLPSTCVETVQ